MPADANLPFGDKIAVTPIQRMLIVDSTGASKILTPYNTTTLTKADVTAATAWTTGNSPVTLFTVTGTVIINRIYAVVTTLMVSTANTGTLSIGVSGSVQLYLPTTTVNGTNFTLGASWLDATATTKSKAFVAPNSMALPVLSNGDNVILTIATNSMTAGGMTLYCDWTPVSSGATVA